MAGTKTVTDEDDSQLTCQCSTYGTAIASCSSQGKTVTIKAGKWAGDLKDKYGRYTNDEPRVGTLDEVLRPEFNKQFAWGSCVLHYCSDAVINNNWTLERASPCQDGRTGPLCGHCRPGLSVTPFDLVSILCDACTGTTYIYACTVTLILIDGMLCLALQQLQLIDMGSSRYLLHCTHYCSGWYCVVGCGHGYRHLNVNNIRLSSFHISGTLIKSST